jgi:hypothetical protein
MPTIKILRKGNRADWKCGPPASNLLDQLFRLGLVIERECGADIDLKDATEKEIWLFDSTHGWSLGKGVLTHNLEVHALDAQIGQFVVSEESHRAPTSAWLRNKSLTRLHLAQRDCEFTVPETLT